jgi:hypothetical protein
VYKDNDIVSQHLAGDSHSYEKPEVDAVLWALQQQQQPKQAGGAVPLMQQPLMVDVGANVGTFLFKIADAGYRVAAFEGLTARHACLASCGDMFWWMHFTAVQICMCGMFKQCCMAHREQVQ